jgi:hypothetical protein
MRFFQLLFRRNSTSDIFNFLLGRLSDITYGSDGEGWVQKCYGVTVLIVVEHKQIRYSVLITEMSNGGREESCFASHGWGSFSG